MTRASSPACSDWRRRQSAGVDCGQDQPQSISSGQAVRGRVHHTHPGIRAVPLPCAPLAHPSLPSLLAPLPNAQFRRLSSASLMNSRGIEAYLALVCQPQQAKTRQDLACGDWSASRAAIAGPAHRSENTAACPKRHSMRTTTSHTGDLATTWGAFRTSRQNTSSPADNEQLGRLPCRTR